MEWGVKDKLIEKSFNKLENCKECLEEFSCFLEYSFCDSSRIYSDYFPVLLFLLVAIVLTLIFLVTVFIAKQNPNTEKLSAYECGFEPYEDARHAFDIKFYLVAILFIVFDIETMYLLPWSVSISKIDILGFWSMVDFIIELSVGLVYVWYVGALEWDLCVREEQWFACWAHDPEIVSSSLTSNICILYQFIKYKR